MLTPLQRTAALIATLVVCAAGPAFGQTTVTKILTLEGTGFPGATVDTLATTDPMPPGYVELKRHTYALAGIDQIPLDATIVSISYRFSSGSFHTGGTPQAVEASIRGYFTDGSNYYHCCGTGEPTEGLEVYATDYYAYGGWFGWFNNPSTGQPWRRVDLPNYRFGWWGRFSHVPQAIEPGYSKRLSVNDYEVHIAYREAPPPVLTVSPSTITRGETATFTILNASGATISDWAFTSPTFGTVTRTADLGSTTWSGPIVAPGTATVRVVRGGATYNLSSSIDVAPRLWFWQAETPQKVSNGTFATLPSPPSAGSAEGTAQLDLWYSFTTSTIGGDGPNRGFQYVATLVDSFQGAPTRFRFQIVQDLDSKGSPFYKAQCGNYNASTDQGFIGGATLRANVVEHESGLQLGHYQQYLASQDNPANNIGVRGEARVAGPNVSTPAFVDSVETELLASRTAITQATASEAACNFDIRRDATCTFRGYINFSPYQRCR